MIAADGTPTSEFTAASGDPEAQAILPALAKGATKHLSTSPPPLAAPAPRLAAARAAVSTVAARGAIRRSRSASGL